MNMPNEDRVYWEEIALDVQTDRTQRLDGETAQIPDELEDLLWALAEGRSLESDESRLWELVMQHPVAATRLSQIQSAIMAVDDQSPELDPKAAWSRIEGAWKKNSIGAIARIRDLVLSVAAQGLDLLESTGQAAFAPAIARSDQNVPCTSIAQQFLTSIGTVRLTIAWRQTDDSNGFVCDAYVEPLILAPRISRDELIIELQAEAGDPVSSSSSDNTSSKFDDLPVGGYKVIFRIGQNEEARLSIELRTA